MATPAVRHPVGDPPARWITIRKPRAEVLNGGQGRRSYYGSAERHRRTKLCVEVPVREVVPHARDANHTMTQSRGHR